MGRTSEWIINHKNEQEYLLLIKQIYFETLDIEHEKATIAN